MGRLENHAAAPENLTTYRCVLDIFRMTTHNGPGIRTLVQFKGCPLSCIWCSTPESQKGEPELAFYPAKCTRCDRCVPVCLPGAIKIENECISIDRSLCDNCGKCTEVCYVQAIKLLGRAITVEEVLEEAKKDEVFYRHSQGGVTLSGGEPLLHPDFTGKLLRAFKKEGISVGIDTCGYVPWENLEQMLPFIDFFLWDIKHMDPETHKKLTGVSNKPILSNAHSVSERNIPVYVRVPLIPGCNDSEENIRATCEFAKSLSSLVSVDLMPLHHLGKARYDSLNRDYLISDTLTTSESTIQKIKQLVQSYGLNCNIVA